MQYFGYGAQDIDVGGYGYRWRQRIPQPIVEQVYDEADALTALRGNRCVRYMCDVLQRDLVWIGTVPTYDMRINCDEGNAMPTSLHCSLRAADLGGLDFSAHRLQPNMQVQMPDGGWYKWPLGVFLPISPRPKYTATGAHYDIECYDMTVILRDDKLVDTLYIPAGARYLDALTTLIQQAGIQFVIADNTDAQLPAGLQYEIGTERLYIANELLRAINYEPLWADERGYINLRQHTPPYERAVKHRYIDGQLSVLAPEIDEDLDSYDAPNVIIGVVSRVDEPPLVARWENRDPASTLSIERRGRRVVRLIEMDDALDQDALQTYVNQEGYRTYARYGQVQFATLNMPGHGVRDMLYLQRAGTEIAGRYMETGWSMELRPGATMTHTAQRVVII